MTDRIAAAGFLVTGQGDELVDLACKLSDDGASAPNVLARLQARATESIGAQAASAAVPLAWHMAINRAKAIAKFGLNDDGNLLFDSDGLQMASGRVAADYHAEIVVDAGAEFVVDMTAGIGADTIGFARAGLNVLAFEADPVRARFLKANLLRLGLDGLVEVRCADSTTDAALAPLPKRSCVYLDPPRRSDDSRWGGDLKAERMVQCALQLGADGVLVKLAPAADHAIASRLSGAMEFVSIARECKEAVLRIGSVDGNRHGLISAVLAPSGARLTNEKESRLRIGTVHDARFLYEPDPAVIRAGLVDALAEHQSMFRIDPAIAYLFSDEPSDTPFASPYRILGSFPYHRRTVQAWLDEHGAGSLIVKKRGLPDDPDSIRRQFKFSGGAPALLALTRQGKRVWAFMLETLDDPAID